MMHTSIIVEWGSGKTLHYPHWPKLAQQGSRASAGRCHCDRAWGGDDCSDLQLEVGKVVYGCYPTDPLQCDYSAWGGGPPVFDHKKNVWVMFQDHITNHCGLSEWRILEFVRTFRIRRSSTHRPTTRTMCTIPSRAST